MAHFVKLDKQNNVTDGIVISNDIVGETFPESEPVGQAFIADVLGLDGTWLQTSYNNNFRGVYAGIGYTYNKKKDIFVAPILPDPTPIEG